MSTRQIVSLQCQEFTMTFDRSSQESILPLGSVGIAAGTLFEIDGRYVKIKKIHDHGVLEIVDQLTMVQIEIRSEISGERISPTLDWLRERYIAGEVRPVEPAEIAFKTAGRTDLMDPERLLDRDPDARWRRGFIARAYESKTPRTDSDLGTWINEEFGRHPDDNGRTRPSGSTLKRWIRNWLKSQGSEWNMIFVRGRRRRTSQLDPRADRIADDCALWYWASPQESKRNAWFRAKVTIRDYNANLKQGEAPLKNFSEQTMRNRIDRFKCYDTVKAKHGKKHAEKLFKGAGEGLNAASPLEIALMDATVLEQVIVFDEDWQLPACRIRIVALMDLFTNAILGYHVYPGPDRAETSIEAVLNAVAPPGVPDESRAQCPTLDWIMGKPSAILPDNAKTLIGPSTMPSFEEAGITIMMPPVETPTAKAKLERWFSTLKARIRGLPGTIIDPKRAVELEYDPVAEACLTLPQLRKIIDGQVAAYNSEPQKALDNRSPVQIWEAYTRKHAIPVIQDQAKLRRILGRTDTALLTRNGIEKNRLRWRDGEKVRLLLSNLANTASARQRASGDIVVTVKIRWNPGNLDTIQVFDEVDGSWTELPSTSPMYTKNLSEWEHEVYQRCAKRRKEAFETQENMLVSRENTLREIDEMAPKLAFQRRREMASLYVSESVKKLSGKRSLEMPEELNFLEQNTSETARTDTGLPREQSPARATNTLGKILPPARSAEYFRPDNLEPDEYDWDFGDDGDIDAEIGREEQPDEDELPPGADL